MKISVAITSYNYSPFLAQAIDSVFAQTLQPDEVFVVDDASADGDISEKIAKYYNIDCYRRNVNHGPAKNFEDILKHRFTGDVCMYLGADNYLAPQYIEECSELLQRQYAIVTTDTFLVGEYAKKVAKERPQWFTDAEPHPIWCYTPEDIGSSNWIHGSAMFHRDKALEAGGFTTPSGETGVDWDLWKNIINHGGEVGKINKPMLYYRQHRMNYNQQNYKL